MRQEGGQKKKKQKRKRSFPNDGLHTHALALWIITQKIIYTDRPVIKLGSSCRQGKKKREKGQIGCLCRWLGLVEGSLDFGLVHDRLVAELDNVLLVRMREAFESYSSVH